MFAWNLNYIAGALAFFFFTLAVYKALSKKADKRAAAAKSLAQSHRGQDPSVSFHNPYPNGAPIPEAPPTSAPEQRPAETQSPPRNQSAAPPSTPTTAAASVPAVSAPTSLPEDLYKWN